jgi:hypothetical protein
MGEDEVDTNKENKPKILERTIKPEVYLAGPIEVEGDTWRERASNKLRELGFLPVDPLRSENIRRKGKHLESDMQDAAVAGRNKYDLHRAQITGGFVLMNLNTTKDGRRPTGTLFELQWCADRDVPVIAIIGRECDPNIRTHPWVTSQVMHVSTSVTAALEFIEEYMT